MRKPHIRKRPFGYEVAVPAGRDPITKRYEYRYGYAATFEEAEEVRDRLLDEIAAGREPKDKKIKFGDLLDDMLELADIEFTTRGMYQGYIERTIRPALGDYEIGFLEKHPELLDRLYASGLVLPDRPGVAGPGGSSIRAVHHLRGMPQGAPVGGRRRAPARHGRAGRRISAPG